MDTAVRMKRRWSDNDRHLGPLTFTFRDRWRPLSVMLCSGSDDRENPGCNIRFQAFGCTLICELPQIIKPWRKWVDLRGKSWASGDGFWDEHPREYGFCLNDGHLSVHLGAQTHDSETTQDWGCFLPWTQWRQVAHRLYHSDGLLAADVAHSPWDEWHKIRDGLRRAKFAIIDHDGERVEVETFVEEREWRLGTGWFKWLGYLAPKKRSRAMDLAFKKEIGPEKGSWKGGTVGHGIEMMAGETQEQAMRRYCEQDHRSKYRTYKITFAESIHD